MESKIDAEIHMYPRSKAAISFQSEAELGQQDFMEILFFTCYALRQFNNLGRLPLTKDLAKAMSRVEGFFGRIEPPRGMDLPVLIPYPGKPAKHYFEASLVFGDGRYLFLLEPRGYGFISWHLYPHAAVSVILLCNYLSALHPSDEPYWKPLAYACTEIAYMFEAEQLHLFNMPQLALKIAQGCFT